MTWPMFQHVERRASRMHEMMDRLGVDVVALARHRAGDSYAEARKSCLDCQAGDQCLRWLDRPQPPGEEPLFCPGFASFEAFRRRPPAGPQPAA